MRTVVAVPTTWPGAPAQIVQVDPVRAAGLPSNRTLVLPATTFPVWLVGTMDGSEGWRPTCGGVLRPDEPATTAGFPPISTVVERLCSSGAENGIGGPGCGAPLAGVGGGGTAAGAVLLVPLAR